MSKIVQRFITWRLVGFAGDRRSVVSLEVGLMAVPLFLFTLGTMEVCYDLYVQEALDYAAFQAARSVSVGKVPPGLSEGAFVANYVCPNITGMLLCGSVVAQLDCLTSGSNFYTAQQAAQPGKPVINVGLPTEFMYLQLWYNGPSFVSNLIPGIVNKSGLHITFASSGFVNEQYVGGQQC